MLLIIRRNFAILVFGILVANTETAFALFFEHSTSTTAEALAYLDNMPKLKRSSYWPNLDPESFSKNLHNNIEKPAEMYAGRGTNFCAYGALGFLFLQDDPLGYAKFLMKLFEEGEAQVGKSHFKPSSSVRNVVGRLRWRGRLDISPAEQMFYLTLADHYKGYINIFNLRYDEGDEDSFWASANYAKFNRMVRNMLSYKVSARGSDLIQPRIKDLYEYLSQKINEGTVILYLNNRMLTKKKHEKVKFDVPTHFVVLQEIRKSEGGIVLIYWDYGHKTLQEIKPEFLKKIVFGVSVCTK